MIQEISLSFFFKKKKNLIFSENFFAFLFSFKNFYLSNLNKHLRSFAFGCLPSRENDCSRKKEDKVNEKAGEGELEKGQANSKAQ